MSFVRVPFLRMSSSAGSSSRNCSHVTPRQPRSQSVRGSRCCRSPVHAWTGAPLEAHLVEVVQLGRAGALENGRAGAQVRRHGRIVRGDGQPRPARVRPLHHLLALDACLPARRRKGPGPNLAVPPGVRSSGYSFRVRIDCPGVRGTRETWIDQGSEWENEGGMRARELELTDLRPQVCGRRAAAHPLL